MPLRIGIVTDGLVERVHGERAEIANGGVGVYIHSLVENLRAVDRRNTYYLIRYGPGRLDLYSHGHRIELPLTPSLRATADRLLDLAHLRAAREHGLDLLHYPNQFGGAFLPPSLPRVVTLHDLTPLLFPAAHPRMRALAYRLLLRPALRRAAHVIVDAEHTRADLIRRLQLPPDRVTAIPLGKAEHFRPGVVSEDFARRYAVPSRYVLTVGVLEPRKNHRRLVEALARLHACGENVSLVIAGREGWRWRDPLDEPGLAHLRPWVRVYRHVPDADLPELYGRAEVFAYPSLYEGFGLPVVEAMACGVPVVTSNVSSLPEVGRDAALYVDPGDAADLADKLLLLLRDPARRARLRAAGEARASELTWRRTAERTVEVYEGVMSGVRGR